MRRANLWVCAAAVSCLTVLAGACSQSSGPGEGPKVAASIKMATTTSTDNSGLLAALLPAFKETTGIEVKVIAVGTGAAIKLGENGDVDVILVHARAAEDKFVADGFGVDRRDVMHNDFIIVGPGEDPAGVKGAEDVAGALKKLSESGSTFVSRGDDSGTHKKELSLWKAAGIEPSGEWYVSAGQGMGAVLKIANEKRAYTITDRGTYIAYRGKIDLPILVEGDKRLFNPYGVIAVNPKKHAHVKHNEVMKFIEWLTSEEGQKLIANFKKDGEVLFYPDALSGK